MFCAPGIIFGGTEGVESRFHVLCSRTHFRRCGVCRVPFSCFSLPDSFTAVSRVSGPFFMFCETGLIFDGTECMGSRFHVLCSRTHFRRCRVRRVPFSCFVLPDSFSAVPRASSSVFMFCAPGVVFDGTEGVVALFHVLHSRTLYWWYRGRRVRFSCFALPDSFSTVPRASDPFFKFYAPGIVFDGTEGVGSCFHVLCSRTRFRLCRVRRVTFSSFTGPETFSVVPSASGLVFMFCAPGLIFGGIEGIGSLFHVMRARTHFRRYRGHRVLF
jgi:hypothetical protein